MLPASAQILIIESSSLGLSFKANPCLFDCNCSYWNPLCSLYTYTEDPAWNKWVNVVTHWTDLCPLFVHGNKVICCLYDLSTIPWLRMESPVERDSGIQAGKKRPSTIFPSHQVQCRVKRERGLSSKWAQTVHVYWIPTEVVLKRGYTFVWFQCFKSGVLIPFEEQITWPR